MRSSITLWEDLLKDIDRFLGRVDNRSAFFEQAARDYLARKARQMQEARDLDILNQQADALNREAEDVLFYQAKP